MHEVIVLYACFPGAPAFHQSHSTGPEHMAPNVYQQLQTDEAF